jgi:hypothetical protein
MKKLLSWGGVSLITGALLDPLIESGMDKPIPWFTDILLLAGGIACLYILIRFHSYME